MSSIKPEYVVPTMKEIEETPWNGYNVVSTFSGGGGSCLGYRMAGYKVLWANEFVEEAQNTYMANHKGTFLDTRDIREIEPEDILSKTGLSKGEIDLFDGSPPCCAFSTAGKVSKSWGKERDYSDGKTQQIETLFYEYIRLVKGTKPKVFVAENVSGMIKGASIGWFNEYLREMKLCGYNVRASLLNSAFLGVPQARQRVIFIGVREDIGIDPVFPKPYNYYYTVADAFQGVQNPPEEVEERLAAMKGKMAETLRKIPKNPKRVIAGSNYNEKGSYFNLQRLSMLRPSSTILAMGAQKSTAGLCHPLEDRKLTIAELKRLTSLPDDFVVTGNLNQQGERIGRMVPPIMMKNIAMTIKEEILDKQGVNNA